MTHMFGVYLHFPYCRKRCPYCDFAVSIKKEIPHKKYEDAVREELLSRSTLFPNRSLSSLYLGGGTPSLWHPDSMFRIIQNIFEIFPPTETNPEVTLEADPLDLLESPLNSLAQWRKAGINRLSIGVQSLQDRHLKQLGRLHTASQAQTAIHKAQDAGFENLSLDLMIGLPGQTQTELQEDLLHFLRLAPTHISIYQLTVEPNTSLSSLVRKGKITLPDLEIQATFYQTAQASLDEAGFSQYEISSYALRGKRDFRSVHNRLYWNLEEYLGLGVSAHSFRRLSDGSGERFANIRSPERYLDFYGNRDIVKSLSTPSEQLFRQEFLSLYEHRSKAALVNEGIWLGLRQIDGISKTQFIAKHGIDSMASYEKVMTELQNQGLLLIEPDQIRLSPKGILFADEVALHFV